jgi:predicted GNAT superfamily acetyltransferase
LDDSPWATAHAAAAAAGVSLRPLTSVGDADGVLEVMIATWGNHQLLPREMIVALGESGNAPFGALDDDGLLVGYVLGWAGVDEADGLHVHSHMLAALPDRRHRGVGYALKLAQRAQALDQDVHVVRWTFDPMVARNAWVNLGKLGAVADRFRRDFYGAMTDTLNDGERSDRLVVRWDLDREPGPRAAPDEVHTVTVPTDYQELRGRDPAAARAARDETAAALETHLGEGRVAVGFDRDRSAYLLAAEPGRARAGGGAG